MDYNEDKIQECKACIEKYLNWGDSNLWSTRDFESLSNQIFEKTKVSLSVSTLRRVWGHSLYDNKPSVTTLDALASFAGYDNWRSFQQSSSPEVSEQERVSPNNKKFKKQYLITIIACILLGTICFFSWNYYSTNKKASIHYTLDVVRTSNNIPSTVIFKYGQDEQSDDILYIQKNWDSTKTEKVNPHTRTHTATYYEPGVHIAKLITGGRVVREKAVLIPTKGWVGLIANDPVPIYLKQEDFYRDSLLTVSEPQLRTFGINTSAQPRFTQFYNVGNFAPIPLKELNFSSMIKHGYPNGASSCQFTYVMLYTDQGIITVPFSQKGCVGKLSLVNHQQLFSGRDTDLSGFGTDLSHWTKISVSANADKLIFRINEKEIFSFPLTKQPIHIVGVGYFFLGTGSVKDVQFSVGAKNVFTDFLVNSAPLSIPKKGQQSE